MGKVYSVLTRPIRMFNIDNRAERIISKAKPTPAPSYPSVKKQKEIVHNLNPNFMETYNKKDIKLHNYLKEVYVSSTDSESKSQEDKVISNKPLPQNTRQPSLDMHRTYNQPAIKKGKCSLLEAIELITMYQQNPTEDSVEKISQKYNLDKEVVVNIIMHFAIFNIQERKRGLKEQPRLS